MHLKICSIPSPSFAPQAGSHIPEVGECTSSSSVNAFVLWSYVACFLKQYVVLVFLFGRFTLILSQCTCLLQLDFLKFCYIFNNIKLLLDVGLVHQFNCYITVIVQVFNSLCSVSASPSEWAAAQQE